MCREAALPRAAGASGATGLTYYCVRWANSGFIVYRGTDLDAAAEAMEPGTVFGTGAKQVAADSESLSRAMIARREGRGKHGGRRSA